MKKALLFISALLSASASAQADDKGYMTVRELLHYCEQPTGSTDWAFCYGYVRGAAQQRNIAGVMINAMIITINDKITGDEENPDELSKITAEGTSVIYGCLDTRTFEQIVAVYIKWAKANPEQWQEPAFAGVPLALKNAFPPPCE